jgi:ABC-type lipoprotein export system ATPase subunit
METTIIIVTHDANVAAKVDRVVAIRDGRTSTEVRRTFDEAGEIDEEEWVILDSVGRLQLPGGFVDNLSMKERVKIRLEDDHVTVWPEHDRADTEEDDEEEAETWAPASMKEFLQSMDSPMPVDFPEEEVLGEQTTDGESSLKGITIRTENLWRTFTLGVEEVHACQDISIEIPPGTFAVLKGRSGSGKTTLLNCIAGLDSPTQGSVHFGDYNLNEMSNAERIKMRRTQVGFVYQTFGLLPYLSAGENVEVPLRMIQSPRKTRKQIVDSALTMVGLEGRITHRIHELSGGEQQRVAIARALVNNPSLLLADEPTGQLDSATGGIIIQLLKTIAAEMGVTVLCASHDPNVYNNADIVFELQDGQLKEVSYPLAETSEA